MLKTAKPSFKHVSWSGNSCFNAKIDCGENLSNAWHYHPEIELILIKNSEGTRIIGTSVENFKNNDLLLIGKNLPHAFLHEERFLQNKDNPPEAMVLQFHENFLGSDTLLRPEFREIQQLLSTACQGLFVEDHARTRIIPMIEKIFEAVSLDRIIILLNILKILTERNTCRTLIKTEPVHAKYAEDPRITSILDYTYANYDEHIRIDDVAKIANLTRESFCRYFKTSTNKTYLEFLTAFRISKACNMIKYDQRSIKEIGYSCGFDSLSNFYYQFRRIMKLSPLEFKRENQH
ncbi:AraC family transcriptional regulator [Agriterribacter sp.]|uniref:AraC family transcriptional regulator n=1 Tax=Agriterribacter sp. TaxID=2821509 RepID=UPI002B7C07AD|nr:AraC family transcriptional regulator [Agriterribacter sp.]HRO44805.1 AraC family transcriptional regulator [Agriterribacter sp.]HRQ18110.1 AraC family transcriptional regulator [Agriterribacter sp.]